MLDLSRFDKVYCIHYLPFEERFGNIKSELERIGIDTESKKFAWKLTFDSPFYMYFFCNPYFPIVKNNRFFFDGNMKCTLAHYEIYKEAVGMGYERILVFEDDMVCLRDTSFIEKALSEMPDYDIVLFDKWMHDKNKYYEYLDERKINDFYCEYDDGMSSTGMYSITKRGMEHIIANQEVFFQPADYWINKQEVGRVKDRLRRAFCIKNLAIQNFSYDKLVNGEKKLFYHDMSFYQYIADIKEYDIRNMQEEKANKSDNEASCKQDKG